MIPQLETIQASHDGCNLYRPRGSELVGRNGLASLRSTLRTDEADRLLGAIVLSMIPGRQKLRETIEKPWMFIEKPWVVVISCSS